MTLDSKKSPKLLHNLTCLCHQMQHWPSVSLNSHPPSTGSLLLKDFHSHPEPPVCSIYRYTRTEWYSLFWFSPQDLASSLTMTRVNGHLTIMPGMISDDGDTFLICSCLIPWFHTEETKYILYNYHVCGFRYIYIYFYLLNCIREW